MPLLTVMKSGFQVITGSDEWTNVSWADIKEIFAFKVDLFSQDTIRLGFRVEDFCKHLEVDEDWTGFKQLVTELERRFELRDNWWSTVAFPAFAENHIRLWSRGSASK